MPFRLAVNGISVFPDGRSPVTCGLVLAPRLRTGRFGSLSFEDAAAWVMVMERESEPESAGAELELVEERFITGRSESWSSVRVGDCAFEVEPEEASSAEPIVGFELESLGGRFITGRSGSAGALDEVL